MQRLQSTGACSPVGLRGEEESQTIETYHPQVLNQVARLALESKEAAKTTSTRKTSRWLPRMSSISSIGYQTSKTQTLREKLSRKIARISSLDSTRSSSSLEADGSEVQPVCVITPDATLNSLSGSQRTKEPVGRKCNLSRTEQYNNYYGRPRRGLAQDDRQEEEEGEEGKENDDYYDDFNDEPILSIPYSSSSMASSRVVRQQTKAADGATSEFLLDDPLDDRQGMNSGQEQFTKGERAARPSIDGSISISDVKTGTGKQRAKSNASGKGLPGCTKGSKKSSKKDKRRSKSPTSTSMSNLNRSSTRSSRHSRRNLMGLASRLKLTRKHESIEKIQLSILNSGFISLKTMDRDLQTYLPRDRMSPKEFDERVKLMRKFEVLAMIEYRFASRYETYVCRHAQQETNQPKNNYKKCIPYDYNRVVLKTLPNVPDSDYINASHVDSCLKPNAYIAAQGPNEFTIDDFWRMIWEQKSFVVVMLTKVFDFIRVMCNQYWPVELNKPERYGNLEVTLLYEEPLADFVIRTIKLSRVRSSQVPTTSEVETTATSEEVQNNTTKVELRASDNEDEENYDDYSDNTSESEEELVLNDNNNSRTNSSQNLPFVREPKFSSRRKLTSRHRDSNEDDRRFPRSSSQPPEGRTSGSSRQVDSRQPPNLFLQPLANASCRGITHSANSLASIPISPVSPTLTPMGLATPRTPSSAGLDRSSATRKAVKKIRRARVKNNRPLRTQFQVPDENQLLDDNEDELQANGELKSTADRIIYQFHYNSWASHTCPFISSLLHFRRRVRICMDEMSKSGKTGPTIVHCNDGCGRTGAYLAIDSNLELVEEDNVYDVFNYTKKMRQSRKFLIENLEQYKFVYDTIEEAMFCGRTWFPVSELHKRLKHKSQRNPITKKNEYFLEYEKITRMTSKFSIGDCAGGHRVENREKNRDVSTVPPDNFRPYLTSFQSNDDTGYINAVFVDGYTRSKEYIVTEWPLHRTISDFWSLVYDHDCNSVILLANPGESTTYPSFLPSEKELRRKFGPVFSAEMVSYTHYQNIKSWIYTINKKIVSLTEVIAGVKSEAKTTQVFQITCWPQGHRVPTSTNALVELMNMVERWRQRTAYGPVCVVSLNGKSRAGVYCAANVAIEQVVQHSEVDVFQAVKTVRRHRPQLIENLTEYKYCYDLILHYVLHYVNQPSANN